MKPTIPLHFLCTEHRVNSRVETIIASRRCWRCEIRRNLWEANAPDIVKVTDQLLDEVKKEVARPQAHLTRGESPVQTALGKHFEKAKKSIEQLRKFAEAEDYGRALEDLFKAHLILANVKMSPEGFQPYILDDKLTFEKFAKDPKCNVTVNGIKLDNTELRSAWKVVEFQRMKRARLSKLAAESRGD